MARTPGGPYGTLYDDEIGIAVRLSIKVPSRVTVITVEKKTRVNCSSRMAEMGETCSPKAKVTLFSSSRPNAAACS